MSPSSYVTPFWLNGKEHQADKAFDVISPKTGEVVHRCGRATPKDAEAAVNAAKAALPAWKKTTPAFKRDIFLRAADIMEKRKEELGGYLVSETGGTKDWGTFNIDVTIDLIRDVAGRITTLEGTFPPTKDIDVSCLVLREPYGVVLSIAPW